MMAAPLVHITEVGPGIVQVTMNDRINKNAFSPDLVSELLEAFAVIRLNTGWRVVLLTGYETYFASGGTQAALRMLHERKARFSDVNLYSLSLECEIPVIAAMQGHGIGGGFVFGLFADFVVLGRESVYTANFMKYGFTPGMGATLIVPAKLGAPLAAEMLTTARNYRGDDLARRGIAFPVLPREDVLSYALQLAGDIAEKPRASLIALKNHLNQDLRQKLPKTIEQELAMHEVTFHQPEVGQRIETLFDR